VNDITSAAVSTTCPATARGFLRPNSMLLRGVTAAAGLCVALETASTVQAEPTAHSNLNVNQRALISQANLSSSPVTQIPTLAVKQPLTCQVPTTAKRPDPTLVNTDPFVLSRFSLARVYRQLIELSGTNTALTKPQATALFQQLFDSQDTSENAKFTGPHCDDEGGTINGFPITCPEDSSVTSLKDTAPSGFSPVALFNRFDLAPSDGSTCGEYRIVYAKNAGVGRAFVIFEGILPNPNPGCGIEACRPVVDFWEGLAAHDPNTSTGQTALADALETFYFEGLPGFEPVVHPQHYGSETSQGVSVGQIRTDLAITAGGAGGGETWRLREFHLEKQCSRRDACKLIHQPVTTKDSPFASLFSTQNTDTRAHMFWDYFPGQINTLVNDKPANISVQIDDLFNAGQATTQAPGPLGSPPPPYEAAFMAALPHNAFTDDISDALAALSPPRTDIHVYEVVRRAETQSCAGCHRGSNNLELGGSINPKWPSSLGFTHVDENRKLSPALWCTFLPARKAVLDGFDHSEPQRCLNSLTSSMRATPVVVRDPALFTTPLPDADPSELSIAGTPIGPN